MMTLRHIEVFHAVYTLGTVNGAARALNVSQPSTSKVLRHAETRLGFQLFERSKGRLTATDEAHALFGEVNEIYERVDSLRQTAKNLRRGGEGHIRLAVLPGFGLGVAPMAVATFRQQHPAVTFDLQTLHHSDIMRSLHERSCDLAIGYEPPRHPRLIATQIATGELGILYRREDLPDAPPRLPMDVLVGREFVSLVHSGPMGTLFRKEMERQALELTETVTISTLYVATGLVREGVGMAVVDYFTAMAMREPNLEYRPFSPALRFGVYSICLADRPLPRIMPAFVRTLAEVTAKMFSDRPEPEAPLSYS